MSSSPALVISPALEALVQAPRRPEFGKLFGVTHNPVTRLPVIRVSRTLKVGIGIPKGRANQVFIFAGSWIVRQGVMEKGKLVMQTKYRGGAADTDGKIMPNTRAAVEEWFHKNKDKAAISNRPQKVPYFTFTKRTLIEEGGKTVEVFEPDFDAIEAHGDCPRRIPVRLTSEEPVYQEFAWWTASAMQCHGDGIVAERLLSAGSIKDAGWQTAKDAGEKMFLYSPCWTGGCPHKDVDCKPHTTVDLQLARSLCLGSTAYFTSTGIVSGQRLNSSFYVIREAIERMGYSIAGVPLDLVLDFFPAKHEGKSSTQPYVRLELSAKGAQTLRQLLDENSWIPAQLTAAVSHQEPVTETVPELTLLSEAAVLGGVSEPEFEEAVMDDAPVPPAGTATQRKQEELSAAIRQQRSAVAGETVAGTEDVF